MVGLIHGLTEAGIDLSDADPVIGTSAGSVVGALLCTGIAPAEMLACQVDSARQSAEIFASVDLDEMAVRFGAAMSDASSPEQMRAAIGAMALSTETVPESVRRAVLSSRLPVQSWPDRLRVTAVDAISGQLAVFDRTCSHDLVDVVAASCAVPGIWPPVRLGERRYIDGGVRTALNADLAAGASAVLVLAPLGVAGSGPLSAGLDDALSVLAPAVVHAVVPDADSVAAMGSNPLDPATRAPAALAGLAQAAAEVDAVRRLWVA